MSQKVQQQPAPQEPQAAQATQETQVVAQPVVVQTQVQPKKQKKFFFSKLFSVILMLCLVVGCFIPVYLQANRQTGSGSILLGDQTLFVFAANALIGLFSKKVSLSAFISSVSANRTTWWVLGCVVAVFVFSMIALFSKKHTRGWFFLTCVFAAAAIYPYINKLGLVSVAKSIIKNRSLAAFPGCDLILGGSLLAIFFAAIMSLFCFLRALLSSKKRAVFAVFAFLVSVAAIAYTYSSDTLGIRSGIKYFAKIAYSVLKKQETVVVVSEAVAYFAAIAFAFNAVIEAIRIGNGFKAGAFTVFRYLLLAAVVLLSWAVPVYLNKPITIAFTPAMALAIAAIVLFVLSIIAATQNGKKKAAAQAAAAKPQVIVTYVAAEQAQ
jgi:hypothetical protein